jgi:hypothetical protein
MKGKIFNAQEVQAILNGSKVMFREVIKPQIIKLTDQQNKNLSLVDGYTFNNEIWADLEGCKKVAIFRCPYQVGQKIFCKESFREGAFCKHHFKADDKERKWGIGSVTKNFLPAQHMKQEHSRLTLQIKQIRVERLADISEEDAIAEGINPNTTTNINNYFRNLWNCTHKKPEEMFGANPWVFVYQFEVVK